MTGADNGENNGLGLQLTKELLAQAGAIPYRLRGGELEVLLITSRGSGRWLFPKGNIEDGASPRDTATEEAWEEAGVAGTVADTPLGAYTAFKDLADNVARPAVVEMYPLEVATCHKTWPERHQRDRRWMAADDATAIVSEQGLKILLIQLRDRLLRRA